MSSSHEQTNQNSSTYDCIVVGFGGIGSSALFYAARRGWKVLGIDRFGTAHARGSSHGQTRIIRTAYFEHPNYVPLAQQSFSMWDDIQNSCPTNLITRTGLIQVGDPNGDVISGTMESCKKWDLDIEFLSPSEVESRFPIFKMGRAEAQGHVGILEKEAGFLRVERCVANFVKLATALNAEIVTDTQVTHWHVEDDNTISVQTESMTFKTKRLIIACGPWAQELIPGVELGLEVFRKQQNWFQLDRIDNKFENGFPCFLFDTDAGCFYGFPEIDYLGMKIAEHGGGQNVADPVKVDRGTDMEDLEKVGSFLDSHFHFTRRRKVHDSVCLYTRSRDEHFLIDQHPDHSNVVFAAGFSGHGFKFAPVIGDYLTELVEGERRDLFDFFRLDNRCSQS